MHHCSYCGQPGHKRPTCPSLRSTANVLAPNPAGSPFKPGDRVAYGPASYQHGNGEEWTVKSVGHHHGDPSRCYSMLLDDNGRESSKWDSDLKLVSPAPSAATPAPFAAGDRVKVNQNDSVFSGQEGTIVPMADGSVTDSEGWFHVRMDTGSGVLRFSPNRLDKLDGSTTATVTAEPVKLKPVDVWELTETVIPQNRTVLLYGPPGTGKTTVGNFAGNPTEVYNLTLTEETPAAELRGHYIPKGNEFVWQDGPALKAYREGARLVLNEIDRASGDAMIFLHALLDDASVSRITLPTGETVYPGGTFQCVATTNETPEDLTDGLKDRFPVAIKITKPHPEAIKSLPEDLRSPAKKSFAASGEARITFRTWKAFAQLRDSIGRDAAAHAVFGDRAQTVMDTLAISEKG